MGTVEVSGERIYKSLRAVTNPFLCKPQESQYGLTAFAQGTRGSCDIFKGVSTLIKYNKE